MKKLTYLFLALLIVASCSKSIDSGLEKDYIKYEKNITYYKGLPYSGEIFANYKNDQLEFKGNFKDGKRDGLFEWYYKNGQLKKKQNFKDGEKDGLFEWYSENGQLERKRNYKDGKRDGTGDDRVYKDGKEID